MKTTTTILLTITWAVSVAQITGPTLPKFQQFKVIDPNPLHQNQAHPGTAPIPTVPQYPTLPTIGAPGKSQDQIDLIRSIVRKSGESDEKRKQQFPPLQTFGYRKHFETAFRSIDRQLQGDDQLSLKKAVFYTENAYNLGRMSYSKYDLEIKKAVNIIRSQLTANPSNSEIINAIRKYMTDTIITEVNGKKITNLPLTYDFDDPFGYRDANKVFVTKLVKERKGQCKSLPLFFLILAQELGGNAYLSFAPSHTFIKARRDNGTLYNIETTSGGVTSDAWMMTSGFIHAQAVRSGIYLDTLNFKQVIAHCLVDLATYYRWSFSQNDYQMGYDDFNLKCINRALEFVENDLLAILEKSNYYSALLNVTIVRKGLRSDAQVENDPDTREILIQRNKIYKLTDDLGYKYMPVEQYKKWLRGLNERAKREEQR